MKRNTHILVLVAVMALSVGLVAAQTCNEPVDGATRNYASDIFGCTGTNDCHLYYSLYSNDPASNGAVNPGLDGFPFWVSAKTAYRSDLTNTQNFFGATHPCGKPFLNAWDAEQEQGTGSHRGYYAVQSQIIEAAETGNIYAVCGGTARSVSCFTIADGGSADPVVDSPQGTIAVLGGLAPVPVPIVTAQVPKVSVTLSWTNPDNYYITPLVGGDPGTGPIPIQGVNIYILEDPGVLDSTAVTDTTLDASATFEAFVPLGTTSHVLDISTLTSGTLIPVIKVKYLDNAGSTTMESLWSANGPVVRVTQLYTDVVNFKVELLGKVKGITQTGISWETVTEDALDGFYLYRSDALNGPWTQVGDFILPKGQGGGANYAVSDSLKVKGAKEAFYMLEVHDSEQDPRQIGPSRLVLKGH